MTPTYILFPGYVTSQNDGDVHYISATALARLYGLDIRECVVHRFEHNSLGYRKQKGDIHLYPRYNGDYKLPTLDP